MTQKVAENKVEQMDHLATTNNPFGIVDWLGGQWPEGRCFVRTYSGKPYLASRFICTLMGLQDTVRNISTGASVEITVEHESLDTIFALRGIGTVIRGLNQMFPEWRNNKVTNLRDYKTGTYSADPVSVREADAIMVDESHVLSDDRDNSSAFIRVYFRNPYATESLLWSLYGLNASLVGGGMPTALRGEEASFMTGGIRSVTNTIDVLLPDWRFESHEVNRGNMLVDRCRMHHYSPDDRSVPLLNDFITGYMPPDPWLEELAALEAERTDESI